MVVWRFSGGESDDNGVDPSASGNTPNLDDDRLLAADARLNVHSAHYDSTDAGFTTECDWERCTGAHAGATYRMRWPHSPAGNCGTQCSTNPSSTSTCSAWAASSSPR